VFRDLPGLPATSTQPLSVPPTLPAGAPQPATRSGTGEDSSSPAGRAICIFDAESAADVVAVNKQAGLPATDVIEAIDLHAAI
jgi:hypothetical protein